MDWTDHPADSGKNGADVEHISDGDAIHLNNIRARIMAAGYKYQLMSSNEEGSNDDKEKKMTQNKSCGSQLCMKMIIMVLIFIIVFLCAVVAWLWKDDSIRSKVCLTPECVEISAYILGKMNFTADPCTDFYTYSCGGWEQKIFVPPERAKFDSFSQVDTTNKEILKKLIDDRSTVYKGYNSTAIRKVKAFYRTCMDEDKIESDGTAPILKLIQELGGWSVTPSNLSGTNTIPNLTSSLIKFNKLGQSPFFSCGLQIDLTNSSRLIISFSQAGLTLDSEDEYTVNSSQKYHDAFLRFAVKVGKLLGGDQTTWLKMEAIYNLEKQLASIFVAKEDLIDPANENNRMTVADLQQLLGSKVDVLQFLSALFHNGTSATEEITILTLNYFKHLREILESVDAQVLQDYMVWNLIQSIPGYLPEAFVDSVLELNKVERGVSSFLPRWHRCLMKAEDHFSYATSALYIDHSFPPDSKAKALEVLSAVQSAFISNLDTVGWMDFKTKTAAKRKAQAMKKVLGYPDWILDPVKLDKYYENFNITEGAFLETYFSVIRTVVEKAFAKHGMPPNRDEWSMRPDEVNAYFSTSFNQIVVPGGLLQQPFFDPRFPRSFMYGSMGSISGHELTHGFDNSGRGFDENGNLNNWWSNASAAAYKEHSQCMVKQYSEFTEYGQHFNGEFTLAENIADNAGLKLGYMAYQSHLDENEFGLPGLPLTPKQLYFLGFAQVWCAIYTPEYAVHSILTDEHTIAKYRVLAAATNSPQFSEAFSCPAGSRLNPNKRCHLW